MLLIEEWSLEALMPLKMKSLYLFIVIIIMNKSQFDTQRIKNVEASSLRATQRITEPPI
jgi:hypothetical protein